MATYAQANGKDSPGTIILSLIASTGISAFGSTIIARGVRHVGPRYNLPHIPEYRQPGLKNNKDFVPIVTSPLSSFIVSDAITKAVKAIINDAKWVNYAGAAGGWVAAIKQIWESGILPLSVPIRSPCIPMPPVACDSGLTLYV